MTSRAVRPLQVTPLRRLELTVVSITLLGEFLSASVSSPFLLPMVEGFTVESESDAGFDVGVLVSLFFLAQFVSGLFWSKVYAKSKSMRSVLFCSLLLNAVSTTAFGLAGNYRQACVLRMIQGTSNGALGLARAYIRQITDVTNVGFAYTTVGYAWSLGSILGPLLGGLLEHPYEKYGIRWLKSTPYLLPGLVAGSVPFVGAIMALKISDANQISLPMTESDPIQPLQQTRPRTIVSTLVHDKQRQLYTLSHIWIASQSIEDDARPSTLLDPDQVDLENVRFGVTLSTQVLSLIFQYGLVALHSNIYSQAFNNFLITPYADGGLSLTPSHFAYLTGCMAIANTFYQFAVYPALTRTLSHVSLIRLSSVIFILAYVLTPEVKQYRQGESDRQVVILLGGLMALRFLGSTIAYTGIPMMINYASDNDEEGAKANSAAQMSIALSRFFGPLIGGWVWSMSIKDSTDGYPWAFWASAILCLISLLHSGLLDYSHS